MQIENFFFSTSCYGQVNIHLMVTRRRVAWKEVWRSIALLCYSSALKRPNKRSWCDLKYNFKASWRVTMRLLMVMMFRCVCARFAKWESFFSSLFNWNVLFVILLLRDESVRRRNSDMMITFEHIQHECIAALTNFQTPLQQYAQCNN